MSNVPTMTQQDVVRADFLFRCLKAGTQRDKEIQAAELKRKSLEERIVKTKQERIDKAFEEYESMVALHKAQAKTMLQVTKETMDDEVEAAHRDYANRVKEHERRFDVDVARAAEEDARDAVY